MWNIGNQYINNEKTIYLVSDHGNIKNSETNKILKPFPNHKGYLMVRIYHKKIKYDFSVHRLVALHFMPVRSIYTDQVNHKDGNKKNNHIDNLEWIDNTGNIIHAVNSGLITYHKGKDHHMAKYNEELIHKICKLISEGYTNDEIIISLNIKRTLVSDIRRKKTWRIISDKYIFPKLPKSKLFDKELIIQICEFLEKGYSHKSIRDNLNLPNNSQTKDLISKIKGRKYYVNISKKYKW